MNFMKNIFRMAMVAFAAIAVMACEPNKGDNPGGGDDSKIKVNPAWSVSYAGASEIDGVSYKHTAAVISTDENTYTVVVVRADEFQASKLEAFGEALIQDMYSYLYYFNIENGTSYVLGDLLDKGSKIIGLEDLFPGKYLAIAIGITPEGELSGLYAASKPFDVKEEQPTALYSEWLGNWVFKGDNNKSNNVAITHKVANKELYMSGLMGLPFNILGEYSTERNDIIFSSQIVAEKYDFGGGKEGDIHLIGVDRDGEFYGLDKNGSYGIAIAGVIDTVRCIVRYGVNTPGYPKFVAMMFAAYIDGQYYSLKGDVPAFNGVAELAPATTKAAPMSFSFGQKLLPTRVSRLYIDKALESTKF